MSNKFILTMDSKGRITLPEKLMKFFGVKPGDKIKLDLAKNSNQPILVLTSAK